MKKMSMVLMSLFLGNPLAFCCQIILTNDSNTWASVKDLNEKDAPFQPIAKHKSVKANRDPDQHAQLLITIGPKPGKFQTSYVVKQLACSDSLEIPITSTNIEKLRLGKLFTVKKTSSNSHIK